MFERFDRDVRMVVSGAPHDAAATGSTTIEPEHLLLGLVSSPDTDAGAILSSHGVSRVALYGMLQAPSAGFDPTDAEALATVGIDVAAIEQAADNTFGPGSFARAGIRRPRGTARFGPAAKAAMAGAIRESVAAGSKRITSVHLLLALIRDPHSRCATLLAPSGLDYDSVRRAAGRAA